MRPPPDLDAPGTPEAVWRASGVLDTLRVAEAAALAPAGRAVVVAPHPDDEVLGVGGLLATWARAGVPVVVVAVTDGEGSHPDSPTLTPPALAARRHDERTAALDRLGLGAATVVRLGLPDGGVDTGEADLTRRLGELLVPGDLCLAPRTDDGHPDHDATARAARVAADAAGARLAHFAVWWWRWAGTDENPTGWAAATRVTLPHWAAVAKSEAIDRFTTQVSPLSPDPRDAAILVPAALATWRRAFEVLWWR